MGGTPHFTNNTDCLKEEAAALAIVQTGLLAGHRLILARTAKGQHIDGSNLITAHLSYISQMLKIRKAAGGDGDGIGFNLRGPDGRNAVQHACLLETAAPGKQ